MSVEETVVAASAQGASDADLQAFIQLAAAQPDAVRAVLDARPETVSGLFGFNVILRRGDALSRTLAAALAATGAEEVQTYVADKLDWLFGVRGLMQDFLAAAERAGWSDRLRPAVAALVHAKFQDLVASKRDERSGPSVEGAARALADLIAQMPSVLRDQAIWAVRGAPNRTYQDGGPQSHIDVRWMSELVLKQVEKPS